MIHTNMQVYSENALHEATNIDGGEGADELPPLTIFYFRDYQHYQSVARTKGGCTGNLASTWQESTWEVKKSLRPP